MTKTKATQCLHKSLTLITPLQLYIIYYNLISYMLRDNDINLNLIMLPKLASTNNIILNYILRTYNYI